MNIRGKTDSGFPVRDEFPAEILTEDLRSEDQYTTRCCAFFAAIFATLEEVLKKMPDNQAIAIWTDEMCDMHIGSTRRAEFFAEVRSNYLTVCTSDYCNNSFEADIGRS